MFFSLKPTRQEKKSTLADAEMLCDLDELQEKRVYFRVNGKDHVLKPITLERLMEFSRTLIEINENKDDAKKVKEAYVRLISSVCEDFSEKDAEQMNSLQASKLMVHISNKIMGVRPGEKKN